MPMDPGTAILISAGISAATTAIGGAVGASNSRSQAERTRKEQQRANDEAAFNRAKLLAARDDEVIRLHNYNVNNYKKLIPRAFNRAALAYRDNNLQLKELIDQYQFQGQERLQQSVGQQGALAARGITGRAAATQDLAQSMALGIGDQMMSSNLLRARYGTQRANERIKMQLEDYLQSEYNKVAYTPRRTAAGMLGATPQVSSAFNAADQSAALFQAGITGLGQIAAAVPGAISANQIHNQQQNNTPPPPLYYDQPLPTSNLPSLPSISSGFPGAGGGIPSYLQNPQFTVDTTLPNF